MTRPTPTVQAALIYSDNWPTEKRTEMPPTKMDRATHAVYQKRRESILEQARAKGWRRMRGKSLEQLEAQLRQVGSIWPELFVDTLRLEFAYDARLAGEASKAQLKLLADEEASYNDE